MKSLLSKLTLEEDKANHAFYGLVVYSILLLINSTVAICGVLAVAILKEIYDKYFGGTSDRLDVIYTITTPLLLEVLRMLK